MHGKAIGKATLRSLPAWGPTSMQALRGQGLSDVHSSIRSAWN